jgi:hypothetical protein
VSRDKAVLVLGDPELIKEFTVDLVADDRQRQRERRVVVRASGPLTDRQLANRVRAFAATSQALAPPEGRR